MEKEKVAYVTFKRVVVVNEIEGLKEDKIIERAVDIWNEEMELGDILMDIDNVVKIEVKEE